MIEHGLYYVDRAGDEPVRLDDDNPIDLPGARRQILYDALGRAEEDVARDAATWPARNNLAEARFDAAEDNLPPGVYYAPERRGPYESDSEVVLLSGGLFPWKVQGDEKPTVLSLLKFVKGKMEATR